MAAAAGEESVPITALSAQELSGVRDNLESTCNELAERSMQLQQLMAHYSSANRAVQSLADSKPGQPLMMPLTESVYVPATLADTERVMVALGTGYFVQMTTEGANDFCRRKSTKLEGTLKTINQNLAEKRRALAQVEDVLAHKVVASRQQQQAPAPQQQQKQQQPKQKQAAAAGGKGG